MKIQLFILSALLLSAFALPVPDEEVSPVKPAALADPKPEQQPAAIESKPTEELKLIPAIAPASAPALEIKPEEKKIEKVALPESVPDAEITQPLPKKEEEKKLADKQTRADNQVSGDVVKPVSVVEGPVAGLELNKQVVDEASPAVVPDVQGKSASEIPAAIAETPVAETPVAEQKKEELSAVETAPATKSDIAAPLAEIAEKPAAVAETVAIEEKKEEQPARQERDTEEAAPKAVAPIEEAKPEAAAAAAAPATPEIATTELKTLQAEEAPKETLLAAAADPQPAEPAKEAELKSAPIEQPKEAPALAPAVEAPAQPTIGDIPTPEVSAAKTILKTAEAPAAELEKQPEEPLALPALTPEAKKIDELPAAQPQENLIQDVAKPEALASAPLAESAEPLKKLEEKPAAALAPAIPEQSSASGEEKKSEESKESKESESESKESGESKEDKSN